MTWWPEYVPVAERRKKARKDISRLRRKGIDVDPVIIGERKHRVASTVWGKAWCDNMEHYENLAYRISRGRAYVRHGQVLHLVLKTGSASAFVSGSRIYEVDVEITPVSQARWSAIVDRCAGEIGSLVDLLQGKLSPDVMRIVTDPASGLFPSPQEINFSCTCPDHASLCKHVAATLYGMGARFDKDPASLFVLRGVSPDDLVAAAAGRAGAVPRPQTTEILDEADLSSVFGVEIAAGPVSPSGSTVATRVGPTRKEAATVAPSIEATDKKAPSARDVRRRRPASTEEVQTELQGRNKELTPAQARAKQCYEDRCRKLPWAEINHRHGFRSPAGACVAARTHALKFGKPWPIPQPANPRSG